MLDTGFAQGRLEALQFILVAPHALGETWSNMMVAPSKNEVRDVSEQNAHR